MNATDQMVMVGVNGKFGQVLARRLIDTGHPVTGIDLQPDATLPDLRRYNQGDLTDPDEEVVKLLREADFLFLCVSESVTMKGLSTVLAFVRPDALILDIASVKSRIVECVTDSAYQGEYLSLHPMFGPTADFAGRNLAVVKVRAGNRAESVLTLLRGWELNLIELTAEEHDRATAWLQAGAHAALLAWVKSASTSGNRTGDAVPIGNPGQSWSLGLADAHARRRRGAVFRPPAGEPLRRRDATMPGEEPYRASGAGSARGSRRVPEERFNNRNS